ncbi:trigger factor [Geosporobacter ferrireducens]|uniref:Trigger factor n=1 Tax=Geosporobacter ferrireducens TaxID=1424294 RepID=A0A1D8GFR7_9FIRM|nr:trigger factor [Geosporobacter ferrireducens]AOT69759.1 trigger factor [Geosporobacter ferrireducens]MTI54530.1 trigger factor [Geosporobacter ferrireducens]
MSSVVVKKENNEVTLKIEASAAEFEKAVEKSYHKMKGKFNIHGFRKGKAPRKLIEMQYGEGVFYEEAINELFPAAYEKAIQEHNIDPVDRPAIDIEQIGKGQDFIFTATVTVKPEVKLGEYKGIEVEQIEYNVKEDDVDAEIERLRERNSRLVAVERPVKEGDTLIIDYAGYVGDHQFAGGTAENQTLVIGSGQFIPGFEEQLVGVEIGKEVEVKVTFPEEYHAEDLAGQDAVFKVTVHEIKEKEMPELDDEFAKDVSEHDTLAELKEDIRKKQEEAAKNRAERERRDAIVDKAVANAEVDIPEVMVEDEIESMLKDFDRQLQFQGLNLETYLQYANKKVEEIKEQMKDDAYNRVKTQLTLEAIAKEENIEVDAAEVDQEIEKYAKQYNTEVEKFKNSMRPQDYGYMKEGIKIKKAVDFIVQQAK